MKMNWISYVAEIQKASSTAEMQKEFCDFVIAAKNVLPSKAYFDCIEESRAKIPNWTIRMAKHITGVYCPLSKTYIETYMDDEDVVESTCDVFCLICGDKGCIECSQWTIVDIPASMLYVEFDNVSGERFAEAVRSYARKHWNLKGMQTLAKMAGYIYRLFNIVFDNDCKIIKDRITILAYDRRHSDALFRVKSAHEAVCAELTDYMTGRNSTAFWMCATGTPCHPALLK